VLTAASLFPKSGYLIREAGVAGPAGINTSYVAEAGPVQYDRTGNLTYCVINDNIVRNNPGNTVSGLPGTTPATCLLAPFVPLN
jgi:hypothetical protein